MCHENKPKYECPVLVVSIERTPAFYTAVIMCVVLLLKKTLQIHHGTHTHCKYQISNLHCIIVSYCVHIDTCLARGRDQWIRYSDAQVSIYIITSFWLHRFTRSAGCTGVVSSYICNRPGCTINITREVYNTAEICIYIHGCRVHGNKSGQVWIEVPAHAQFLHHSLHK